jgi:AraC-like DNA-binding protein
MLENNYTEHWTISRISRIASMAPSTLLPVFRKVTGYSPIDYLIQIRLAKGAEMLLKTQLPVSEIAQKCGFPDSNYFSRQFRKRYTLSPKEYRQGKII